MPTHRIELASEPGLPDRTNEDLALATPELAVVLDGVTPHPDGSGCLHDVPWYVRRLGAALFTAATEEPGRPLADCLAAAIAQVAERHAGSCDLAHPRTPQSTVAAVRIGPEEVEYLVLSDSVLLIEGFGGEVSAIEDDRLRRLPEPVPSLRAAVRAAAEASGEGSAEHTAARRAYVAAVEGLRNAPDGFFTAAAAPAAAHAAVAGRLPRSAARGLALLTDGAARLVEVFGTEDWADTFRRLRTEGPEGLVAAVRKAEAADPDGTEVPRGKPTDDATAVLVRLDQN
ncbi:hypothetical protein BIV57_18690 [Mangrovactinospora gilvigrisea]|uniref:PPM-type phosphatase domain-containing protein n=1 Tax=Mangrovactinospora gilvigrisea TaxID=1428644 RepID=A0A1J7C8P6_9ACTN|nr:protein phosphatase 2C domain-containing protein [Mangrovactinospora gilvigrisea]OIV36002.1 hypothetical protein BIV57_18690 [Mangrovactinospora gilvigrisea]